MYVVGLTGGIGSGKSEAAKILTQLEVPVVDVDIISHQLTAKGSPILLEIAAQFGREFLQKDGTLNRAALREKVFGDALAKQQLEAILHPAIFEQAKLELAKNNTSSYQVLAVPLLFESARYQEMVNYSLLIDCDQSLQISRVMQRSQMTELEVQKIMNAQMPRLERLKLANEVIKNDGNLADFTLELVKFHKKMLIHLHS